jgi:hypothetical protein
MSPSKRSDQICSAVVASISWPPMRRRLHVQLATDLLHVDGAPLVGEGRVARDHEHQAAIARQAVDDVVDHTIGEVVLVGLGGQVLERQDGDRRHLARPRRRRGLGRDCGKCSGRRSGNGSTGRRGGQLHAVDAHGTGDVLQVVLAIVEESYVEPTLGILLDACRNGDAAGLCQRLQPRCDVDAIAEDIVLLDHNVADMDAHAELDAAIGGEFGIALRHLTLHVDGAAHGIDDAGELDQQAVARGFDQAAAVVDDAGFKDAGAVRGERGDRALFIEADEAAVACDVGGQHGGEPPVQAILRHHALPLRRPRDLGPHAVFSRYVTVGQSLSAWSANVTRISHAAANPSPLPSAWCSTRRR